MKHKVTDKDVTVVRLAMSQIELMEKFCNAERTMTQITNGLNDIITNFNKANHELAKRIQTLESKCEDLEKILMAEEPAGTLKSNNSLDN